MKDYYKILQVDPKAEQEVIEGAFKRLARKYHPDHNPDPDAAERMKEINEAYEVLSDPQKRSDYDKDYFAQRARTGTDGEPILAVRPPILDFGRLPQGEVARKTFTIENQGAPLPDNTLLSLDDSAQPWAKVTQNITFLAEPGQLPIQAEVRISTARLSAPKTHQGKILVKVGDQVKAELQVRVKTAKRSILAQTLVRVFRKARKVAPDMVELVPQLTLIVISGYAAKREVTGAIRREGVRGVERLETHLHILTTSLAKAAEITEAVSKKLAEED